VGIDACYQAIPERPLLERAEQDREFAQALPAFHGLATRGPSGPSLQNTRWIEISQTGRALVADRPRLLERHLSTRWWDAIYWLLAPNRRANQPRDPNGLAEHAVFGTTSFRCGAQSTIGTPIRFVWPHEADAIARCLTSSVDRARETFDADAMKDAVYKAPASDAREELIDLLLAYARIYRGAADDGDCVLVSFD
jgi:hypothetical protein